MLGSYARVNLKSPREIELMRAAGRIVCQVLDELERMVRPGATTAQMNARATEIIRDAGGTALFKGVENEKAKFPFPAVICASVNDVVVHGIPNDVPLVAGDVVSVDCGVKLRGYCGDAARTLTVGQVKPQVRRLLDVTQGTLALAVAAIKPGRAWSEVARQMQAYVEEAGFGVVRDFVGHGIGQEMHEEPQIPNYDDRRKRHSDFRLEPGMALAIEPMVTAGRADVKAGDASGWPIVTKDGSYAAHFEHTVAVTPTGADVLTDGR